MVVTAATPQVWRAVRLDREKVLISPAPREYATMTKQVRFERLKDAEVLQKEPFQGLFFLTVCFVYLLQAMTQMPIAVLKTRRRME